MIFRIAVGKRTFELVYIFCAMLYIRQYKIDLTYYYLRLGDRFHADPYYRMGL